MNRIVIAIDGPAGAGKSTTAKAVAQRLGIRYLDTGAMYRALALKASRAGITDGAAAAAHFGESHIEFGSGDPQPVILDGEDITAEIRTPEIGDLASALSAHSDVRRVMLQRQQELVADGGVILEGRDATTRIAPNADLKIYLTASLEERAKRRRIEFEAKGIAQEFVAVRAQIEQRDHRDINRDDSPLTVAPDAEVVETGGRTVQEIVDAIVRMAEAKSGA